jgi:integrase
MGRTKLTAGRVRDYSCTPGAAQSFLWDSEVPGLAVRATLMGAKSFIFQGKIRGKTIRQTIGDVRTWDIESNDPARPGAREEARRLQSLIDQGIDPRHDKAERAAATEAKHEETRRQVVTVTEAWDVYIEARRHTWGARHLRDHKNLARPGGVAKKRGQGITEAGPLAALMPLKLSDLTPEQVEAWLKKETAIRPTYAALAYRVLRAFLRWCSDHKTYQAVTHLEAVSSRMAKDHVPRVKAKEGDCLQREQLSAWFKAVRQIKNPVQSAYLQVLLLTGARREEVAAITWADVDFRWQSLTIRDKVEGERIIPLTPYIASLLAALPCRKDKNGKPVPWVFSSPTAASGRIQEPRAAHIRALEVAGLPHLSIHGLRRSFGTLAEWVDAPAGVVAQIMGHKPSAIAEKHYRRRALDLLRMWHIRIEAWMLEESGIETPKEVKEGLRLVKA